MISKNSFLIFNNVLRELYQCQTYGELGQTFLPMLKMLIPFRYASIMRSQEGRSHPPGGSPVYPCRVCRSRTQLYALCR